MTDMQTLFATIDSLTPAEREQLERYLKQTAPTPPPRRPRILGLSVGAFEVADDFDDPLPDSFWLGEE